MSNVTFVAEWMNTVNTVSGDCQITIRAFSLSEMVSGLCERTTILHEALPTLFKS